MIAPHTNKIHALHGFLGTRQDWSFLNIAKTPCFSSYHLFQDFPILPFNEWTERFNSFASGSHNIVMGYSLGGRLGLHALLQQPEKWKAAILVSTHPGLKSPQEKVARIEADEKWAIKFKIESWNSLMQDWNAQSVFQDDGLKRKEIDYSRESLSLALNTWSLGKQDDLTHALMELDIPVLWLVGEEDKKFVGIAQELAFKHPKSKVCVVPHAGHRVPWDQPEAYELNVTEFIRNLEE